MNNTQKKSKDRKISTPGKNSFLAAFVFGFAATAAMWLVLSALVPLVLSGYGDAGTLVPFVSPIVLALSLVFGGFVSGKLGKTSGVSSAVLAGTVFLAFSYLLSTLFKLTNNMSVYIKTAYILMYIICPVFGARIAKGRKKSKIRTKRRGRM